jgi:subtilisin family serine protease
VRRALLAALASSASLLGPAGAQAATTGRILVTFAPHAAGTASAASAVASAAARPDGPRVPALRLVTVRPRAGTSMAATLRALRADPRVRSATPERQLAPRALPDDPALTALDTATEAPAGTPLEWTLPREGFAGAWDLTAGDGATVAVIDTGIDASHPEFHDKIAAAIDLDDVASGPATADPDGHGTHVASLACAATGNALGIAGAGRNCTLLVIRSDFSEGSVIAGLVAAAKRGAQAINMSFGGTGAADPALGAALRYAVARGAVPVAAAADEPVADQGQPASLLQPAGSGSQLGRGLGLVVTAANGSDARASFAGYGSEVSMAAYGTLTDGSRPHGIIGAYPAGITARETGGKGRKPCKCRATIASDSRYAFLAGTSMAAPQVTGAAALMRTVNPRLGVARVVRLLKTTASRPAGTRWNANLGWGILDAGAAVDAARRVDLLAPRSKARATSPARGTRPRVAVRVRLTRSDPSPGALVASGVRRVELWASRHGHSPRRIARTARSSVRVRLAPGRYALWSIAVDRAGNRERRPARPDVRLRVIRP